MAVKELVAINFMLDRAESGIVSVHDLAGSDKIKDKSKYRLNFLLAEFWKKHSHKVDLLFTTTIYCKQSKKYYVSIWDLSEMGVLESITANGDIIQVDYFCVYKKENFKSKKEVIDKYEKTNFLLLLEDEKKDSKADGKETKKIKKVYLKSEWGDKKKSQGNGSGKKKSIDGFYQKKKKGNIMNFFQASK